MWVVVGEWVDGEAHKLPTELSDTVVKAVTITYTKYCGRARTLSSVTIIGVYGSWVFKDY